MKWLFQPSKRRQKIIQWSYLTVSSRRPPFQDSRMKSPLEFLKMTTSWLKSSEKARIEDESSIAFTMASEKKSKLGRFLHEGSSKILSWLKIAAEFNWENCRKTTFFQFCLNFAFNVIASFSSNLLFWSQNWEKLVDIIEKCSRTVHYFLKKKPHQPSSFCPCRQ